MFSQEVAQASDEQLEEVIAEEYQQLSDTQANLPSVKVFDEISKPLGRGEITTSEKTRFGNWL
jgi:hypothetical protein